jgi:hypothetical protein
MNTHRFVAYAIAGVLCQAVSAFSQEAILPQGDPRLRDSDEERAEVRDSRLKQQGQGKDYRVEGKRQGGSTAATEGDPHGLSRQETGIADPSVNPGQASGMRVVRGEVKQATLKTIVIEDRNGKEATMSIDAATAGDRDIRPGDVITGTVTAQGRAVAIHKEQGAEHMEGGGHGDISPRQAR